MEITPKVGLSELRERIRVMAVVAMVGVSLLVGRLFYVQVIDAAR